MVKITGLVSLRSGMRILRRHKKAAVRLARGRRRACANAHLTLSTIGGSLLSLESRIMFDGAAVATVSTVTTEQATHQEMGRVRRPKP